MTSACKIPRSMESWSTWGSYTDLQCCDNNSNNNNNNTFSSHLLEITNGFTIAPAVLLFHIIVGQYSSNPVCESLYFRIFFICFGSKLLKYCSKKPAFPFKVMLLYYSQDIFRMIPTEYYYIHSMMFLLKCYVFQPLVYNFLCFLTRQIYLFFLCIKQSHSVNNLCVYFHQKCPWILYPSGVVLVFPIAFPTLRLQYRFIFLSPLPIAVLFKDSSVTEQRDFF